MRGHFSFFSLGIVLNRHQSFICLLSMRILLFEDAWPFHQSHPKPLWIHQGQLLKSVSFQRDVEKTATTIRRKLHHDFALFDLAGAERGEARCKNTPPHQFNNGSWFSSFTPFAMPHLEMEQCGINFRHKSLSVQVGYFLLLHSTSKATSIHPLHIPHLFHPCVLCLFAKTLNSCLVLHLILNQCKNFSHNMTHQAGFGLKKGPKTRVTKCTWLDTFSCLCRAQKHSCQNHECANVNPPVRCISPNKSPMRRRDLMSMHLKKISLKKYPILFSKRLSTKLGFF